MGRTTQVLYSALLSQDSTYSFCCRPKLSLPFLPAGVAGARAGAAGVRRVCGMSVGPRAICHVRLALFHNIEG